MKALKDINWREELFPKRDDLPRDLTSLDILKTVAIALVIIDHIGWLFFPDVEWFRVLGRMCVPMWFFLIGFADTREVPGRWMAAAIVLVFSSLIVGLPPFALPILFTFALIRLTIDPFWSFAKDKLVYFWWFLLLLAFVGPLSDQVIEYGTFGFLLALGGMPCTTANGWKAGWGQGCRIRYGCSR